MKGVNYASVTGQLFTTSKCCMKTYVWRWLAITPLEVNFLLNHPDISYTPFNVVWRWKNGYTMARYSFCELQNLEIQAK